MNTLRKLSARFALLIVIVAIANKGNAREIQIRSVQDVIQQWSPDQHLYVKGDVGVSSQQLARLEQWLDENGPHWTVVLMRDGRNEQFQSLDGRRFTGIDAVAWALGKGLNNRTTFGELENAATGETDGAVFVLYLMERKFDYYSSEAQDRRGLGHSNWLGRLDSEAIRAMRNGGRILDAVKNTVKQINSGVESKIAFEQLARQEARDASERAAKERARAIASLRATIKTTDETLIGVVEQTAERFKSEHDGATGALARPPVDEWRKQLATVASELSEDNLRVSEKTTQNIIDKINRAVDEYAAHSRFDDEVEKVRQDADEMGEGPNGVASASRDEADRLMDEARKAHKEGDPGFIELIRQANDQLAAGNVAINNENEQIRRNDARRRVVQKTALGSSAVTGGLLMTGLVVLNRRRKPALERAKAALDEREKSVEVEMDKVYKLIERSSELLGSEKKLAARGYVGTTQKLSKRTLSDVDDLLVMSTEVERVMDEARDLIRPANPIRKVSNMFSGSRFERGVNRITGEPLKFDRDKGLPLVIKRDEDEASESGKNNGATESGAADSDSSISMTFEEVFSAFHERSESAASTLDLIESSLLDVNDRLAELQSRINHAADLDQKLDAETDSDTYFDVPAFFTHAIPAAQADYDAADAISGTDPVFALQKHIPSGWRKITESLSVAQAINKTRDEVFPKLDRSSPQLEELGYDIKWIEQAVFELGDRANQLFEIVPNESIAESAKSFSYDVSAIGERAEQSVALAKQLAGDCEPAISGLREKVDTSRAKVAKSLGIAESKTLHEHQRDPDSNIASANELLGAARAALHHGGIEAASRAIHVLEQQLTDGHQFVDDTLDALSGFESAIRNQRGEYATVTEKAPSHESLVSDAKREYAASALVLRAGDPGVPDPRATTTSLFADSEELLADANRATEEAATIHQEGKVLEAAELIKTARIATAESERMFDVIAKHCALLKSRSQENIAKLTATVSRTHGIAEQIKDPRTQRETISRFEIVVRDIQESQVEIERSTSNRDPFRDASTLGVRTEELDVIDSLILADRNAHSEAERAVKGAQAQHRTADGLVRESRTDQLPDSNAVQACQREIAGLSEALTKVANRLTVAHEDWQSVDSDAARINAELGVAAGRLRNELQMAQESVEALKHASQEVFNATRWTGGFGIRVFGSPGSSELDRARRALQSGDYGQMLQLSRAAILNARQAVQTAQREVARRQREAAHAAEAERRRRRAASRRAAAASSGGSILGGGGRGGSWSGSSGSSSRGSSSGGSISGSGFSRSGW